MTTKAILTCFLFLTFGSISLFATPDPIIIPFRTRRALADSLLNLTNNRTDHA